MNKRQGTEYQLQWRDSPDFVRLAAKTNAIIIPFACVGGDDAYDVFMDTDTVWLPFFATTNPLAL